MSLTKWLILHIVMALLFGWFLGRDREMRKEFSRATLATLWLLGFLIATFDFVFGLIFPEIRLFNFQPF